MRNYRMMDIEKDFEKTLDLFLEVFTAEPWNDKWESREHAKDYLMDFVNTPGFLGFIAEEDDKIIGASFGHVTRFWIGKQYLINEFFISGNLQGKGYGTQLVDFIKQHCLKENYKYILLNTDRETPAEFFYKKLGFEERSDEIFFYLSIE